MIYSHVTQLAPENQLVNNTAIFPFGGEMSFLRSTYHGQYNQVEP